MQLTHLPLRIATGAYILNSGLSKRALKGDAAEGMHAMAGGSLPLVKRMQPEQFARVLFAGETALGAALLIPLVPSSLVGAALVGFSAGLMRLYIGTPGMREPGSLRPTPQGIGLAKDVWLLGAGLTLILDSVADRRG
jgi:hypothetical protein